MDRRSPPTSPSAPKRRAFDPGLLASPFYRGPTAYGGAGAADADDSPSSGRCRLYDRVKVTPAKPTNPTTSIGQTSKRIWELLAHCSSPLADAKRAASVPSPSRAPASASAPHRLRELRQPAMATLLRLKRNNRKVANAQAAIAASLSSSLPFRPEDYEPSPSKEHTNKMRTKLNGRSRPADEERPPDPVSLPAATLDMTGKDLPKITFDEPPTPATPRPPGRIGGSTFTDVNGPSAPPKPPGPFKKFSFRDPLDAFAPKDERYSYICPAGVETLKVAEKPRDSTADDVKKTVDPTFASLMKKQQAQWECNSCLSRNGQDKTKCVCCEAPRPGSAPTPAAPLKPAAEPAKVPPPPTPTGPSLSGFVQKQKSQWECQCCLARNDNDRNKCLCCETPRPGAEKDVAAPKFNFGTPAGSSFKFGIQAADAPAPAASVTASGFSAGGFTFGVKPAAATTTETDSKKTKDGPSVPSVPSVGFTFSPNQSIPKIEPKTDFKFGTFTADKQNAVSPQKTEASVEHKTTPPTTAFTSPIQSLASNSASPVFSSPSTGFSLPAAAGTSVSPLRNAVTSANTTLNSQATSDSVSKPAVPTVGEKPASMFTFGKTENKTPFGFTSPPSFNFSTTAPVISKPTEGFSFGAVSDSGTKSTTEPAPKFSTANSVPPKDMFAISPPNVLAPAPSTETTLPKETSLEKPSVPFQSEKPTEQPSAAPPVFNFSSPSSSSLPSSAGAFKNNSAAPMFTFGATTPTTKTDTSTPPPFGGFGTAPRIFGAAASPSDPNKTTNSNSSIFKSNNTPVTSAPATFSPMGGGNIFGSKSPIPNLFGNQNQQSDGKPVAAASIFGSNQLNSGGTAQLPTASSIFSNPPVQSTTPFNSGNVFGSSAPGVTNGAQPVTLFGSSPMNKPNPTPDTGTGMFGAKTQSPQTGAFFGATVPGGNSIPSLSSSGGMFGSHSTNPAPVFGGNVSFGENAQPPSASLPFRFGAPNPSSTPVGGGFGQPSAPANSTAIFSFGGQASAPQPAMNSQFNFSMGATAAPFPPAAGSMNNINQRRFKKAVRRNPMR